MDEIIGERLSSVNVYRNFGLIFNIIPPLYKKDNDILFFDEKVFIHVLSSFIFIGIYQFRKEEGLWIRRYVSGQKSSARYYHNGKKEGLWVWWYQNGQKISEEYYRNGQKLKEKYHP